MNRRRWTEDLIRAELLPIASELGRMPRRAELADRGIGGIWNAMSRRGGMSVWRDLVAEHLAGEEIILRGRSQIVVPRLIVPPHEHIAVSAYFKFQAGQPGGQLAHWLSAERELLAA